MSQFKLMDNYLKPREKLKRQGIDALSDQELLAIILGSGTKNKDVMELANDLITGSNGIYSMLNQSDLAFQQYKGIGPNKSAQLVAIMELCKRVRAARIIEKKVSVVSPAVVYELCNSLVNQKQESVYLITLNIKYELISISEVYKGLLASVAIEPRDVFRMVFNDSAFGFILVHNHPSGDSVASDDDLVITRNFVKNAHLLSLEFIDHIVVSANDHYSIRANHSSLFKID